jgi:F-type H+-transporting ATPase subunit alpha
LGAALFDTIPLEKMIDAETAVQEAAAGISADVSARLDTATKLSDEDRKTIVEVAKRALSPFQPKSALDAKAAGSSPAPHE